MFRTEALSVATPAPHTRDTAVDHGGSGSHRSIHTSTATTTASGTRASAAMARVGRIPPERT